MYTPGTSMANPLPLVKATVEAFKSNQFKVDVFSADQGILTQSLFRVAVPAVQAYLKNQNIIPECGEAYNHNNGTPYIEHSIRQIKELQRFAMLYIPRNPNFHTFGFTRTQILKHWALYVYRHASHSELQSQHDYWQFGLYGLDCLQDVVIPPTTTPSIEDPLVIFDHSAPPILQSRHSITTGVSSLPPPMDDPLTLTHDTPSGSVLSAPTVDPVAPADDPVIAPSSAPADDPVIAPSSDPPDDPVVPSSAPAIDPVNQQLPPAMKQTPTKQSLPASSIRPTRSKPLRQTPETLFEQQRRSWGSRSERYARRNTPAPTPVATVAELLAYSTTILTDQSHQSNYVDWAEHTSDVDLYYFSFADNAYVRIGPDPDQAASNLTPPSTPTLDCFRAVRDNVPRTYAQALRDPVWGDAARSEFNTILVETKSMVRMDPTLAKQHIHAGAEVLHMHPVYEEKLKEGKLVRKVRLVINGKRQTQHGTTYSSTPSREEFLVLLHLFAIFNCDYYHIDEKRAFLRAPKLDNFKNLVRISGDPSYYN
eukprot:gene21392-22250_t